MENNINKKIIDQIEYLLLLGYKYDYETNDKGNIIILCKYMDKANREWCDKMGLRTLPMSMVSVNLQTPYNKTTAKLICQNENNCLFDENTKAFLMKNSNGKLTNADLKEIEKNFYATNIDFESKCNILYDLFSHCNFKLNEKIQKHMISELKHLINDGINTPSINKNLKKLKVEKQLTEEKQLN